MFFWKSASLIGSQIHRALQRSHERTTLNGIVIIIIIIIIIIIVTIGFKGHRFFTAIIWSFYCGRSFFCREIRQERKQLPPRRSPLVDRSRFFRVSRSSRISQQKKETAWSPLVNKVLTKRGY